MKERALRHLAPLDATTTGAPGAEAIYAASRNATGSTITALSARQDGGSGCASLNYGPVFAVAVTHVLSVSTLGSAPYRVARTP